MPARKARAFLDNNGTKQRGNSLVMRRIIANYPFNNHKRSLWTTDSSPLWWIGVAPAKAGVSMLDFTP